MVTDTVNVQEEMKWGNVQMNIYIVMYESWDSIQEPIEG